MIESYPLYWPDGFPREGCAVRTTKFKVTPGRAQEDLLDELSILGADRVIVSCNVRTKPNGMPYVGDREPKDAGVAVYFEWKGKPHAMACDRFEKVWQNVRALALSIEALRALERHGSSAILERAFRGFAALPASVVTERPWYVVLGVPPDASWDLIEGAWRARALSSHPDKGGSAEAFQLVTAAWEEAKRNRVIPAY